MTSFYQAQILHIIIRSYPWWHLPDSINNQTQIGALTSLTFFRCCQQPMNIISSGSVLVKLNSVCACTDLLYTITIWGRDSVMNIKPWSMSAKLDTQFRMGLGNSCVSTSPDQSSVEIVELKAEEGVKFISPFVGLQEKKKRGVWGSCLFCCYFSWNHCYVITMNTTKCLDFCNDCISNSKP